jgi:hypothetical protein
MSITNPYRCGGNCVFGAVTDEEKLKPCVCLVNSREDGETLRVMRAIMWMLGRFERLAIDYRKRGDTIYALRLGLQSPDNVSDIFNPCNEEYKNKEEEVQNKRREKKIAKRIAKKAEEQRAKTAQYIKGMGLKPR